MRQVEIRIRGQIDRRRSDWFEGLDIEYGPAGETILSGQLIDQSVLYGLLTKLRDLGLELLSVQVKE
jgi:hypothetical protein